MTQINVFKQALADSFRNGAKAVVVDGTIWQGGPDLFDDGDQIAARVSG